MRLQGLAVAAGLFAVRCSEHGGSPSAHEMTSSFIREYERKYADYRIHPESLPTSNLEKAASLGDSPLWRNSVAELTLRLGERTALGGGRFKTSSRYELRDSAGALISSAESVLARDDLKNRDLQPSVRIAFDSTSSRLLIVEEHSWSVERMILLPLSGQREAARYVRIPLRRSFEPFGHYEILAFQGGKVFMRQDGALFAFPMGALQTETNLSYSIGATTHPDKSQQVVASHDLPAVYSVLA